MSEIKPGDRINNYIVEELIGSGSFGLVYKARHHVFENVVAIKIPTDAQYVQNLRREGVAIHGLQHPNIVRALDMDPFADPPYLIMEYLDGPTLRQILDDHPEGIGQHPAVNILRGILAALSAAHRAGLVHRDIKPSNILLGLGPGEVASVKPDQVKVTDFGLGSIGGLTTSSIMQSVDQHAAEGKSISGTLVYMSPEQRDGKKIDQRSDLYACGVVLFEMLTGVLPQGNDLPSHIRPGVPEYLDAVFKRCYTRLGNRFRSAEEIQVVLDQKALPSLAPAASPIPQFGRSPSAATCKNCSAPVRDEDQFCIRCGNQLVDSVPQCPSCQAFVYAGDDYCIICGVELKIQSSEV